MAVRNIQSIRRMVARLQANPEIQATLARNSFAVAEAVTMILDMNSRAQDFRYRVAFQWCEEQAEERWRRRICERRGHAVLDAVVFEFENEADATALRDWLTARGW